MDFPSFESYEGVYKERQHGAARALYDAVGVERSDKEGRLAQFMKNFDFFGAPTRLLFLCSNPLACAKPATWACTPRR